MAGTSHARRRARPARARGCCARQMLREGQAAIARARSGRPRRARPGVGLARRGAQLARPDGRVRGALDGPSRMLAWQATSAWRPGSCSRRRRTSSGAPGSSRTGCATPRTPSDRWDTFRACRPSRCTSARTCRRGVGEFDGAFEAVSEFRRRLRELGRETEYAVTSGCVWDVCLWAGEWKRGEEALREGYELLERMGNKGTALEQSRSSSARPFAAGKDRRGGAAERDRRGAHRERRRRQRSRADALRAKVRAARGDLAGAEELARRAVELPTEDRVRRAGAADARLVLAEVLGAPATPRPGPRRRGPRALRAQREPRRRRLGARVPRRRSELTQDRGLRPP